MNNLSVDISILKNLTILYVEDDVHTQEIIAEILREFCDDIRLANDSQEALNIFSTCHIDLLISDIEMPGMNGLKLFEEIRKVDSNIPVIMLSAYTATDYLLSSIRLNVLEYIVKPISYTKIEDALLKVSTMINSQKNIYFKISPTLYYDKSNSSLIEGKNTITLQKKESFFLELLTEAKGNLVRYSVLEKALWTDFNEVMTPSALRTVVKKLRQKTTIDFISNVSGLGYKLIF